MSIFDRASERGKHHSVPLRMAAEKAFSRENRSRLDTLRAELRANVHEKTIKHDQRYTAGGQLRPGYAGDEDIRHSRVRRASHPQYKLAACLACQSSP